MVCVCDIAIDQCWVESKVQGESMSVVGGITDRNVDSVNLAQVAIAGLCVLKTEWKDRRTVVYYRLRRKTLLHGSRIVRYPEPIQGVEVN